MNRDRRNLVANIFADAAKYILTAGIIGSILAERFSISISLALGLTFLGFCIIAYFVTSKNKEE